MDGCPPHPKKHITKLHVNWGRASAQHPKRAFMDSEGDNLYLANYVDDMHLAKNVARFVALLTKLRMKRLRGHPLYRRSTKNCARTNSFWET